MSRGATCSKNGREYECLVSDVCKKYRSLFNDHIALNDQHPHELGGCSNRHDIVLSALSYRDVGVEVKKQSPDWMQMSVRPCVNNNKWVATQRVMIPEQVQCIFLAYANTMNFQTPPFFGQPILQSEWVTVQHMYKDKYLSIPTYTIANAYAAKGVLYIQLKGYGLYHTGADICKFGVPLFECEHIVRMRCKRHGKKDSEGKHIPSSVMMSFRPRFCTIKKSPFSLDDPARMPLVLQRITS